MSAHRPDANRTSPSVEAEYSPGPATLDQAKVDVWLALGELTRYDTPAWREQNDGTAHAPVSDALTDPLFASVQELPTFHEPPHPISRTPLDVLGIIFEDCATEIPNSNYWIPPETTVLSRQLQPFRLASVCRVWRQTALAHPRMWANIELDLDRVTLACGNAWLVFAAIMLSRSRQVPLRVTVSREGRHSGAHTPLVDALLAECGRFFALSLITSDSSIGVYRNDALLALLRARLPLVRKLCVRGWDCSERIPHIPGLRSLVVSVPMNFLRGHHPNLAEASLQGFGTNHICLFLAAAPALHRLDLQWSHFQESDEPQFTCASVTSLSILHDSDQNALPFTPDAFAHRIRFPAVEKLTLQGSNEGKAERLEYFAQVAGTMPYLTTLILRRGNLDVAIDSPMFTGLSFCRALDYIDLCTMQLERAGLSAFCNYLAQPFEDGTWPCPRLTRIDMSDCTLSPDCDAEVVVSFVEKRLQAACDESIAWTSRPGFLGAVWLPISVDPAVKTKLRALLHGTE